MAQFIEPQFIEKCYLEIIPEDIEKYIFSFLDIDSDSFRKYEDISKHKYKIQKSLNFINRDKLEKYINSKFTYTYSATHKYSIHSYHCLALYGFEISKNGDIIKGNGRYKQGLGFSFYRGSGKIFIDTNSIKYHKIFNNYNKKQIQVTWLLSKILLTDKQCEK